MKLTLYNTPSSISTANKDLSTVVLSETTITPYGAVNITRPTFIMDYSAALVNVNYAKVEFSTGVYFYYFVTVSTDNGGQIIVNCRRDPLTSFITQIKERPATVIRYQRKKNGKTGATKIVDSRFPVLPNQKELFSTIAETRGLFNADTSGNSEVYNYCLTVLNGGVSI